LSTYIVWRLGASKPVSHMTDALAAPELGNATASLLRDPAIEREYADLVLREVERLAETGCVLTARGLGRDYPEALARIWLDAVPSVREDRTRGALDRDAADRARGRLLDADPSAIHVNGADSAGAVAAVVVRLARMRLCF
jgi:hypothetical protein